MYCTYSFDRYRAAGDHERAIERAARVCLPDEDPNSVCQGALDYGAELLAAHDYERAERVFRDQCANAEEQGCRAMMEILETRCAAHDEPFCVRYAELLHDDDPIRALGTLEASCERGHQIACSTAASWKGR